MSSVRPPDESTFDPAEPPKRARWVAWCIVIFAAIGTLGGVWVGWTYWRSVGTGEYLTTPRGATRTVELPDGTTLQLDSSTLVERRYSSGRREVVLTEGQLALDVPPDAQAREFHVVAGDVRLRLTEGQLSVRHTRGGLDAGMVRVEVAQGQVWVAPPGAGRVTLEPGQQVVAGPGRLGAVAPLPAEAYAVWRRGQVEFANAPLAQALDEFERYGPTNVIIRDNAVAQMPVSGRYAVSDAQGFTASLPQQLDVHLNRTEAGIEILPGR